MNTSDLALNLLLSIVELGRDADSKSMAFIEITLEVGCTTSGLWDQ